jgi:hypothetical protein
MTDIATVLLDPDLDEAEEDHIVCCCDHDVSLCGADVSDLPMAPDGSLRPDLLCGDCRKVEHAQTCPVFGKCLDP